MKPGKVFWGTFFVVIGLLILINNFAGLPLAVGSLWKLWPVIIILIGVGALLKDWKFKWTLYGGTGIIAAIIVFTVTQKGCNTVHEAVDQISDPDTSAANFRQHLTAAFEPGISKAEFSFEAGAGSFRLLDTTSHLIETNAASSIGGYVLENIKSDSGVRVMLSMRDKEIEWKGSKLANRAEIKLNPAPEWDMEYEVGAASMRFDLRPYKVRNLSLNAGASSIELQLGARSPLTDVAIDAGASSITVKIPRSSGCEIESDAELSSKSYEDFEKAESGLYRTSNYDKARNKIRIVVNGGISSIKVRRVSDDTAMF